MKIIEIADFHVAPEHIEQSRKDVERVCEVAKAESVDAICSAGDFFHKAVMSTDKHKYGQILELAEMLQDAAPVVYITGTPSHDALGSYEAFKRIGWKEVSIGKSEVIGDLLLMGMPEITPALIAALFPELDKAEIIAKQYELINQVIDSYYSPLAISHNGPVHFMIHGHISGSKFRSDQAPRTSEFMFNEEMLSRIKSDRIHAGHLHLPQKFKTINGSYTGTPFLTWNDINFQPGFNVVEFWPEPNEHGTKTTRYEYDKPMRQKIVVSSLDEMCFLSDELNPGVDTWIDIECNKEFADQFDTEASLSELNASCPLGPLSKITLNIQHEEHIRVDTEEYEACKTTEDLYKLYDPEATPSILRKVHEAEVETGSTADNAERHSFEFMDLYLRGSKAGLENGVEEIRVNWNDFVTGANLLTGPNGTGKSFIMGFCQPFSEHLPTGSDFKSLFELKDSQIVRRFRDGENIITQKILIDPLLSTPTAKYYMDINGSTDAFPDVKGNKQPFDDAVNKLFGSIQMFMSCVFRGQDFNPKYPTLDKARESDLRQIFTELSGTDRAPMKKYAHDKAIEISREIDLIDREIETLQGMVVEPEEMKVQASAAEYNINTYNDVIKECESQRAEYQSTIDEYNRLNSENENINKEIKKLESEKNKLSGEIFQADLNIKNLTVTLHNSESLKEQLYTAKLKRDEYYKLSKQYQEKFSQFNNSLSAWQEDKDAIDKALQDIANKAEAKKAELSRAESARNNIENDCEKYQLEINHLNKPCEHCGKLSSTADIRIAKLTQFIADGSRAIKQTEEVITELTAEIEDLRNKWTDKRKEITEKPVMSDNIRKLEADAGDLEQWVDKATELEITVNGLAESERLREKLSSELNQKNERVIEINRTLEQLHANLNKVDDEAYQSARDSLSEINQKITSANTEIGRLTAQIEALQARLVENGERIQKISERTAEKQEKQGHASEWDRIESAFSPKGIPALELSLIAPLIDREANRLLNIYGTRFRTEIITQDYDSRNQLAEKFKILVHDSQASEVKNLPVMSGSQRVWVTSAISDAISEINSQRSNIRWAYKILDEVDGALDSESTPYYYQLISAACDGKKKTVSITHSTEAKEAVSNNIDIREFFVDYSGQI